MNAFYKSWIATARLAAQKAGLCWNPEFDPVSGKIHKSQRWGLRQMIGLPPPEIWLGQFSHVQCDVDALAPLRPGSSHGAKLVRENWREFLQAAVANELLIKQNKVSQAVTVARALRTLSLCSRGREPWEMTAEDIQLAYNVALRTGDSGKLAMNVRMATKILLDREHLADRAPLAQFAEPFDDDGSRRANEAVVKQRARESANFNVHALKSELNDCKSAEKLPERRAFWEMVRIVFTETPRTFTDRIRFNAIKLKLLTEMRIEQHMLLPADCLRWRDYYDAEGRPAGERGGFSRSLTLRYFAAKKQNSRSQNQVRLVERTYQVPNIFEETVVAIVEETLAVTAPLRQRLKEQTTTARIFPEYSPDALMSDVEAYVRIAGSIRITDVVLDEKLVAEYRDTHDIAQLTALREQQRRASLRSHTRPVRAYWQSKRTVRPSMRDAFGNAVDRRHVSGAYFRVDQLEDFVRQHLPTKLPDVVPHLCADGRSMWPYEFLFLHPSRSLIEGRNDGVIDVEHYFSIGKLGSEDLMQQLSGSSKGLFARYGETPADRELSLHSHSGRHLQTTELLRLGIADTALTKHHDRNATVQTRTYDHRKLAEDLDSIDLPPTADILSPELQDTLKLIRAGKMKGPLVEEFESILATEGEVIAFGFLAAEAEGFHVTPYGFCLNSFSVDPCPKHLQCFNGCLHLARTDNPAEEENLRALRDKTSVALQSARAAPARTIGRRNQIRHAESTLTNIDKALLAAPGQQVFPNGQDLSNPVDQPGSIIDAALRVTQSS